MIVKPKETTIAYRCPHCGGAIKSIVGVFALNAEMLKIKCPCKKSEMTIKYSSDKKIRITVPCFVCRTDHTYTVNESVLFSGEMFYLNCRYSGVDICFTGKEDEVAEEIDKTLDELSELLDTSPEELFGETEEYDEYYLQKGDIKVTIDEERIITAVATFICDDAKQYNLTFKTPYQRAHLPYDTEEGEVNYTYEADSYVTVQDWIEGYGLIYLELVPADFANVSAFYFAATEMDPDIAIPAGVYPINYTFEPGTVIESKGIAMDGYPLESYFCTLQVEEDENGELALYYDELYCMVDGTVTVEKLDGGIMHLEVDAVNSYDQPIKLSYTGPVYTGVEDITTPDSVGVKKVLINGQMYIIRNGVTYTATGAKL